MSTAAEPGRIIAMDGGIAAFLRPHRPTAAETAATQKVGGKFLFRHLKTACGYLACLICLSRSPPHPTPPHPTPPHPIPPTFRQFWAKFTPWLGFQPDEKEEESEASRVSNNVESGPSASHELVAKAAALTTGKSRKVQAGDNELLINPWHLVKTKSNWNFSPPKAAALAPGESP